MTYGRGELMERPEVMRTCWSSLTSWMMRVGTPAAVTLLRAEDCEGPHGVLRLGGVTGRSPRGGPHSYAADEEAAGGAEEGFQAGHAASREVEPGADWWTTLGTGCSWRPGVAPAYEEEAPNPIKHSGRPDHGAGCGRDARAGDGRPGLRRRRSEGCGYSEEAAPQGDWGGSDVPQERGRPVDAVPTIYGRSGRRQPGDRPERGAVPGRPEESGEARGRA